MSMKEWKVFDYFQNQPDKYLQGIKMLRTVWKRGKYVEKRAKFYLTEEKVPEKEVFIYIDVYNTMQDGIQWYESVLLKDEFFCDGNSNGYLEAKYFKKVKHENNIIFTEDSYNEILNLVEERKMTEKEEA